MYRLLSVECFPTVLSARSTRRSLSAGRKGGKKEVGKYSASVQLPVTNFSQRANAAQREPQIQQFWADNNIYDKVNSKNKGCSFILHDGPPYANGKFVRFIDALYLSCCHECPCR